MPAEGKPTHLRAVDLVDVLHEQLPNLADVPHERGCRLVHGVQVDHDLVVAEDHHLELIAIVVDTLSEGKGDLDKRAEIGILPLERVAAHPHEKVGPSQPREAHHDDVAVQPLVLEDLVLFGLYIYIYIFIYIYILMYVFILRFYAAYFLCVFDVFLSRTASSLRKLPFGQARVRE